MANLFTVTAPLTITNPDGDELLMAEFYKHPKGLLVFEPYWHLQDDQQGIQLIKGWIEGEGPWKISGHVIKVLSCLEPNTCAASDFNEWQAYRLSNPIEYPPEPMIDAIACKLGASLLT